MDDCAQRSESGNIGAVPSPPGAGSGPAGVQPVSGPVQPVTGPVQPRPGGCRAAVRDALDAALCGIRLGGRDRRFLRRLVHWDKRNAATVASLLSRARQAGRSDVIALSARQLEIVLTALADAGLYRTSGAATVGCWDCENIPGGRCADHARDADRARACAELATQLAVGRAAGSAAVTAGGLPPPAGISGFRQRTPVAS
jgi:hypothetical protein